MPVSTVSSFAPPLGELIAQVAVGQGYLALLVGKYVYGVGSLLHNEA